MRFPSPWTAMMRSPTGISPNSSDSPTRECNNSQRRFDQGRRTPHHHHDPRHEDGGGIDADPYLVGRPRWKDMVRPWILWVRKVTHVKQSDGVVFVRSADDSVGEP